MEDGPVKFDRFEMTAQAKLMLPRKPDSPEESKSRTTPPAPTPWTCGG